jgi:hypothetical protein
MTARRGGGGRGLGLGSRLWHVHHTSHSAFTPTPTPPPPRPTATRFTTRRGSKPPLARSRDWRKRQSCLYHGLRVVDRGGDSAGEWSAWQPVHRVRIFRPQAVARKPVRSPQSSRAQGSEPTKYTTAGITAVSESCCAWASRCVFACRTPPSPSRAATHVDQSAQSRAVEHGRCTTSATSASHRGRRTRRDVAPVPTISCCSAGCGGRQHAR